MGLVVVLLGPVCHKIFILACVDLCLLDLTPRHLYRIVKQMSDASCFLCKLSSILGGPQISGSPVQVAISSRLVGSVISKLRICLAFASDTQQEHVRAA